MTPQEEYDKAIAYARSRGYRILKPTPIEGHDRAIVAIGDKPEAGPDMTEFVWAPVVGVELVDGYSVSCRMDVCCDAGRVRHVELHMMNQTRNSGEFLRTVRVIERFMRYSFPLVEVRAVCEECHGNDSQVQSE